MTSPIALDPETSALLVMDFQTAVVEMVPADKDSLLARTARLIEVARKAGMKVIYVVVGFRAGYPEVSDLARPERHGRVNLRPDRPLGEPPALPDGSVSGTSPPRGSCKADQVGEELP
jgi:nicotinamidase-related amidase